MSAHTSARAYTALENSVTSALPYRYGHICRGDRGTVPFHLVGCRGRRPSPDVWRYSAELPSWAFPALIET